MNIICCGDSLMQENDFSTYPQEGWPQELHYFLQNPLIRVLDFALNGRSTKSFIDEGRFAQALEAAQKGDVAFLSFGHNDEKKEDPARYSEPYGRYQANLTFMEKSFAAKGCSTVFITSMTRLKYDEKGVLLHTHGDYPDAMRKLALSLDLPLVDLEQLSYDFLAPHPFEENSVYYMCLPAGEYPNYPAGLHDTSHLSFNGAKFVCRLLLPEFRKIPSLSGIFL
jgi:lysophospholipase L1-like esterase